MPTYTIEGTAEFHDQSKNQADINIGYFFDASINDALGTITNATFTDTAINKGTATAASFSLSSENDSTGTVTTGTFSNDSKNKGIVTNAVIADTTVQNTGTITGTLKAVASWSNTSGSVPQAQTISTITLGSTTYYYSGSLTSGSVTLYTSSALSTKASAASGTNTISGTNSSWTISSQGVLTFSAAVAYESISIGGTTYYYASGYLWDDGNTSLYTNTSLTTKAGAGGEITGIVEAAGEASAYRWVINGEGQYDSVTVYGPFSSADTSGYVYITNNDPMAIGTAMYTSVSGVGVSRDIIISVAGNYYRYTSTSGGAAAPDAQVYPIGSYYGDAAGEASIELYGENGTLLTSVTPFIWGDGMGANYRVTISNNTVNFASCSQQTVGSTAYLVDNNTNLTYDGAAVAVTNIPQQITGGTYLNSVDSMGLFVSIPVTSLTINGTTYYLDEATNIGYNSDATQISTAVSDIETTSGSHYRREFSSSGSYSRTQVYEVQISANNYYVDNASMTSITVVYNSNGELLSNYTSAVVTKDGNTYAVGFNNGVVSYVDQVYPVTIGYHDSANEMITYTGNAFVNNLTNSSVTKIYDSSAAILPSGYKGLFTYDADAGTYAHFSITGSTGSETVTITTTVSQVTDLQGTKHFQLNTTFTTSITTINAFGINSAPLMIVESSGSYTKYGPGGQTYYSNADTVYQVSINGTTYYSDFFSPGTYNYLYDNTGAPVSNLSVSDFPQQGATLTTDSNGQITISG